MNTADKKKALASLARLLDEAPDYGEVGIACRIHAGSVVNVERRNSESFKLEPSGCRA